MNYRETQSTCNSQHGVITHASDIAAGNMDTVSKHMQTLREQHSRRRDQHTSSETDTSKHSKGTEKMELMARGKRSVIQLWKFTPTDRIYSSECEERCSYLAHGRLQKL